MRVSLDPTSTSGYFVQVVVATRHGRCLLPPTPLPRTCARFARRVLLAPLKRSKPTSVGEALDAYLARSGFGRRLQQAQIIPDWPHLVGPQIAAVTRPDSVTPDGTLFVHVTTSAWMTELQLMTPEIMARINAGRGAARIRSIRWLLSR